MAAQMMTWMTSKQMRRASERLWIGGKPSSSTDGVSVDLMVAPQQPARQNWHWRFERQPPLDHAHSGELYS